MRNACALHARMAQGEILSKSKPGKLATLCSSGFIFACADAETYPQKNQTHKQSLSTIYNLYMSLLAPPMAAPLLTVQARWAKLPTCQPPGR